MGGGRINSSQILKQTSERLTCIVVPDSYFGKLSQAEDVQEAKGVQLFALKLVGPVALFQRECPRVSIFPKNNDPHICVSASACREKEEPLLHTKTERKRRCRKQESPNPRTHEGTGQRGSMNDLHQTMVSSFDVCDCD